VVAGLVAVPVVQRLEVVHVHQQDRVGAAPVADPEAVISAAALRSQKDRELRQAADPVAE
jgi:hypothetical protein